MDYLSSNDILTLELKYKDNPEIFGLISLIKDLYDDIEGRDELYEQLDDKKCSLNQTLNDIAGEAKDIITSLEDLIKQVEEA